MFFVWEPRRTFVYYCLYVFCLGTPKDIIKCRLQSNNFLFKYQNIPHAFRKEIKQNAKNNVNTYDLVGYFVNHFNYSGFNATRGTAKGTQVSINDSGNNIVIEASYNNPSNSNNLVTLKSTISDDR